MDVPSYERLAEASFGKPGFIFISLSMFVMSYGGMVGYLMIVKNALPEFLGFDPENPDNYFIRQALLTVTSLCILFPLCCQRVSFLAVLCAFASLELCTSFLSEFHTLIRMLIILQKRQPLA